VFTTSIMESYLSKFGWDENICENLVCMYVSLAVDMCYPLTFNAALDCIIKHKK